jgi:O-antigen ligase
VNRPADPAAQGSGLVGRLAPLAAGACAWATFLPVGAKYLALLGLGAAALTLLAHRRAWPRLAEDAGFRAAAAFWLLGLASLAWSAAPPSLMVAQLWLYGLLLLPPVIALACPPAIAAGALRQFALAAAVFGTASALGHRGWLPAPDSLLWHSTVNAEGNQRIVNSLVLALGLAVALWLALSSGPGRARWAWFAAAALALAGLALQDRRTGMVALPVLLAMLGLARQRSTLRRLVVVGSVAALSVAAWQYSPTVRNRIDEGLRELQTYRSSDSADTSWGMRLRLAEHTLDMVQQAPLLGHGLGSWLGEWRRRVQPGLLISIHTTPHNEYLLVASQLGLAGIALLLLLLAVQLRRAWRAGAAGQAALLAWTAIAWTGLFNVVLRDSKFSLPMLIVAGFAGALVVQRATVPPGPASATAASSSA